MGTSAASRPWVRSPADERAVDAGCVFDPKAAERVRVFLSRFLRHSKGQFAGRPFELQGWQWQDIVAPLYGWLRPDGTRRYRRAGVWVPKKNGKSTLAAALILYGLTADNEPGAEVYGAAADRNQAGIIFNEVKSMVDQSPELAGRLTVLATSRRIEYQAKHSFYQVLSRDSRKTGHGVNSHLSVVDELHVVDRELYGTLRYAGASRRQPLLVEISTAGNDRTSLGYERYQYAKRLLAGEAEDPETLAVVYEADPDADWQEPAQWARANPSLGVTIPRDSFASDAREAAQGSPSTQAEFKQLRLNLWQDAADAWLPLPAWDACAREIDPEALRGKRCWGALDLASKMDLTAWAVLFQLDEGRYALLLRFWAPRDADRRRQQKNLALLAPWFASGDIAPTEGNVADYDRIEADIKEDCRTYNIREVAYDPWNATQVVTHLQAEGVACVEFGQTLRNYNEPMKEAERLVLSGTIEHQGSPVMRWMLGHTQARRDGSGNVRPDRERSADHIDGVTAFLMALGRAMLSEPEAAGGFDFW